MNTHKYSLIFENQLIVFYEHLNCIILTKVRCLSPAVGNLCLRTAGICIGDYLSTGHECCSAFGLRRHSRQVRGLNPIDVHSLHSLPFLFDGFCPGPTGNAIKQKCPAFWAGTSIGFAVREGFEPSVQFPVRQFSKLILSASQAPHLNFKNTPFFRDCKYSNSANPSKKKFVIDLSR
jgi:hypothetical protein